MLTGDPYKGIYIEPLSQRLPNNCTFLMAVLKYIQAKYGVMYTHTVSTNL